MSLINEIKAWLSTSDDKQLLRTIQDRSNFASLYALMPILYGTLPDVNFNEIQRVVNSETSETYSFIYDNILEFQIDVTNPQANFVVEVSDFSPIGLAQGGWLLAADNTIIERA